MGKNMTGTQITKEKILYTAIDLFSEKGYKEITVRKIAKQVGIKASSIYKHYKNKEDILNSIFELFRHEMNRSAVIDKPLGKIYPNISIKDYLDKSYEVFKTVMWTPLTMKIAKIINIEQQRDESVRAFFIEELIDKPNLILKNVLESMIENKVIAPVDAEAAAREYNAYIIFLYYEQNFLKQSPCLEEIDIKMKKHNEFFIENILKDVRTIK